MNRLILEWFEAGQIKTQAISDQQPSKNPGTVRIGRDASLCDIVLSDFTVSPLHAELFFDPQQQCFYLRNLRDTNPPVVNGLLVSQGQVMLDEGTTIQLGTVELKVQSISLSQPAQGYTPTNYATQTTPPYQPTVQATQYTQPPQSQNLVQPTVSVSPGAWQSAPPTPHPANSNPPSSYRSPQPNKLPVILGTSAAVLIAIVGGIAIANRKSIPEAQVQATPPQVAIDDSNPQCRRTAPTVGDSAKLRDQPDRNANVVEMVYQGTLVLELGAEAPFVLVQLSDGSQGWMFVDQLQPCSEVTTTENPPQSQPSTSQPPPAQEPETQEPDLSSQEACEATVGAGAWHNGQCIYDNIPDEPQTEDMLYKDAQYGGDLDACIQDVMTWANQEWTYDSAWNFCLTPLSQIQPE